MLFTQCSMLGSFTERHVAVCIHISCNVSVLHVVHYTSIVHTLLCVSGVNNVLSVWNSYIQHCQSVL